ncbi:hypothetical protein [Streptomyces albiaxialis]|uniref:hypothetical protein n=1 Tax=Streptomyces albiaxialis TaxID=329523 RepID=UPI0031D153AF
MRATLTMGPRDELRPKFEQMVRATGLSHAELVRIALDRLKTTEDGRPEGWHPREAQIAG